MDELKETPIVLDAKTELALLAVKHGFHHDTLEHGNARAMANEAFNLGRTFQQQEIENA